MNSVLQFCFSLAVLVLGAAAEELVPKVLGVGFPVLLTAVPFMAVRGSGPSALAFAVIAGAMEDALAALPPMTSSSYFLAVALLARYLGSTRVLLAFAYPVYQVWLAVWFADIGGGVFGRVLLACPVGWVAAFAVTAALFLFHRKAAVDERG